MVDRARAEGEADGDLAVGGALGGHAGDHQLLGGQAGGRREVSGCGQGGRGHRCAQGAEFGAGLGGAVRGAEGLEGLQRGVQAVSGLGPSAQSAQGTAQQQLGAGPFEVTGAACVQVEGDAVVLDGFGAGREQGAATGAQGKVVGAADGARPAVVVGVRDAGDPGVAAAGGGLDVVRGGQVPYRPVTVARPEPGERAQPGRGGGEPAAAQVEIGERPLGERGGQPEPPSQGERAGGGGPFAAHVRVAGERGEHGERGLQMAGAVVLTGGVRLPQGVRRGRLRGAWTPGPELGVRPELHRLRHDHGRTPGPCRGRRAHGRGGGRGCGHRASARRSRHG